VLKICGRVAVGVRVFPHPSILFSCCRNRTPQKKARDGQHNILENRKSF
jgi:hypothetical protein